MKMVEMQMAARPQMDVESIEKAGITGHRREAHEAAINAFAQILTFNLSGLPTDRLTQVDTRVG